MPRPTGLGRVVDAIDIDNASIDLAAKVEQPVPLRAIARQARCLQAQGSTDMTGTQVFDKAFETGSIHRAARATTQTVVDHFNATEPPAPRNIDQLILPTLALEVGVDLLGCRLPDVNNGIAPQQSHWK